MITLNGGDQKRPNIYLPDLVTIYRYFVEDKSVGVYNVANPKTNLSIAQVVDRLKRKYGCRVQRYPVEDYRSYLVNSNKLIRKLKKAKISLTDFDDSLDETKVLLKKQLAGLKKSGDEDVFYNLREMKNWLKKHRGGW